MRIRPVDPAGVPTMYAIYVPVVERTAISFELTPPSLEAFGARIGLYADGWACLVAEHEGGAVGYACGSSHRQRSAYAWSTETSVYVHADARRSGVGKTLYPALFAALAERGYCHAYGGITLPNEASVALHRSVGFRDVGTFPSVGYEFGAPVDRACDRETLVVEPDQVGDEAFEVRGDAARARHAAGHVEAW